LVDDIWELVQEGLAEFVFLIDHDVEVDLDVRLQNLDGLFPANSYLVRAWGPPCTADQTNRGLCGGENPTSGTRPVLLPTGTKFRIRQWGLGFLPIMNEDTLGSDGHVDLRAVRGETGRGGDFCVQLEAEYGMITTDLIPNEVCDFATNRYGNFERAINDTLVIRQDDLHTFAQIKDGFDYNRTVMGREMHPADVLTGWPANAMTSLINLPNGGDPRAMALCLNFPSTAQTAISFLGNIATVGIGDALYSKDIWWPDAASTRPSRHSRVMTHEYGHFTMCNLLYDAGGTTGLTGLIARMFEPDKESSRDDEVGVMTETIADVYALQVAGGTNYPSSQGAASGTRMDYCNGPLCMDFNYRGAGDNSTNVYLDEIARWVSLTHDAFDRSDSTNRTANAVANGDYWIDVGPTSGPIELAYSATPYLGRDDEPVALPGSDWLRWVDNWLDHGGTPSIGNVMAGLFDTVTQRHSWCDACELLSAHHPAAGAGILMNGTANRTAAARRDRFEFCRARPELFDWLGQPPSADGRFNLACTACRGSEFVDRTTGACTACPAGNIATLHGCTACPAGTVPTANNDCRRCPANQISSGNSCISCPTGQAADATTNRCVWCEPDVVVDWATTTICGQVVTRTIPVNGDVRTRAEPRAVAARRRDPLRSAFERTRSHLAFAWRRGWRASAARPVAAVDVRGRGPIHTCRDAFLTPAAQHEFERCLRRLLPGIRHFCPGGSGTRWCRRRRRVWWIVRSQRT